MVRWSPKRGLVFSPFKSREKVNSEKSRVGESRRRVLLSEDRKSPDNDSTSPTNSHDTQTIKTPHSLLAKIAQRKNKKAAICHGLERKTSISAPTFDRMPIGVSTAHFSKLVAKKLPPVYAYSPPSTLLLITVLPLKLFTWFAYRESNLLGLLERNRLPVRIRPYQSCRNTSNF